MCEKKKKINPTFIRHIEILCDDFDECLKTNTLSCNFISLLCDFLNKNGFTTDSDEICCKASGQDCHVWSVK